MKVDDSCFDSFSLKILMGKVTEFEVEQDILNEIVLGNKFNNIVTLVNRI